MSRVNIIKIDIVLLDEETGDFEFKASIDKEFLSHFNVDDNKLAEGINNLIENYIVEKGE